MPVAATAHTPAGAKAFAIFFMKTIDWGYAVVSGAYLRHYAAPTCLICSSIAGKLDADQKAGRSYIGGRTTIVKTRAGSSGPERSQIVTVNGTAFEVVTSRGKFVSGEGAHSGLQFYLTIGWAARGWQVRNIEINQ